MAGTYTEEIQDFNPVTVSDKNQEINNEELKKIITKLKERIRELESRVTILE